MPFQRLGEEFAGPAFLDLCDLFRCADRNDLTTAISAFGAQIDDVIGRLYDVEIVLDHQNRIAGINQFMQHLEQFANILKVKTGCRFVENVERLARCAL